MFPWDYFEGGCGHELGTDKLEETIVGTWLRMTWGGASKGTSKEMTFLANGTVEGSNGKWEISLGRLVVGSTWYKVDKINEGTGAAYIFSKLKMSGINVELVTEFAKDNVWEESKVDVVITDSPNRVIASHNINISTDPVYTPTFRHFTILRT